MNRALFLIKYAIFWMLLFAIGRFVFILYQFDLADQLTMPLFTGAFVNGGRLDLAVTSYFLAFVALVFSLLGFLDGKYITRIIRPFSILLLLPIIFGLLVDMVLYSHWGARLDSAPLVYLDQPAVIFRSSSIWQIATVVIVFILTSILSIWGLNWFAMPNLKRSKPQKWYFIPVWLFVGALLIIPMRGGIGLAPINTGAAYFSDNLYANHVAINPIFNFAYSMKSYGDVKKAYKFMPDDEATKIVDNILKTQGHRQVLRTSKPNIVVVLLESFSAKAIGVLGGRKDVTPNLEKIAKEGILFNNFYSTSDRSDKGMVGVISGYPVQPSVSIIKFPQKTQSLPFLSKTLMDNGYSSSFFYGGDIGFANMISYISNGGFKEVVSMDDFPKSQYNAKWGVHDEFMFDNLLTNIDKSQGKFFKFLFTLSSHEPFDVPMETVIYDNEYLNSVNYTDRCLGRFWEAAKQRPWFKNTLFIFVADHGVRMIDNLPSTDPERYHIPMIWAGGALAVSNEINSKYGSQVDIASTLLAQLNIDSEPYIFSKNLFASSINDFAFFDYNDGFGFVSKRKKQVYDNTSQSFYLSEGIKSKQDSLLGKAFLQLLYNDFIAR